MIRPPIAGPVIEASWKTVLLQVTALVKLSRGTICGKSACREGVPSA